VLPQDRSRPVEDETRLVAGGIHSRRTAADLLDVADPDGEWERWLEEEGRGREKEWFEVRMREVRGRGQRFGNRADV